MSEKEKEIFVNLLNEIAEMSEIEREKTLSFVEGMVFMKKIKEGETK